VLLAGASLLLVTTTAACGSSSQHPRSAHVEGAQSSTTSTASIPSTHSEDKNGTVGPSIEVATDAAKRGGVMQPQYTCRGADTSPPLTWAAVPASAKEIVIVVLTLNHGHVTFNWALAGLSPKLRHIDAGAPPKGAIIARNSYGKIGYEVCPASGGGYPGLVVLGVVAPPYKLPVQTGFDPKTSLHGVLGHVPWGSVSAVAAKQEGA
jgi:phosphatidylethanolamine-binding protein (PEBP) family uncharacterized protein